MARKARAKTPAAPEGSREALVAKVAELEADADEMRDERSWTALANVQRLIVSVHGAIAGRDEVQARQRPEEEMTPEQAKQVIIDAFRTLPTTLRYEVMEDFAAILGQPLVRVVG